MVALYFGRIRTRLGVVHLVRNHQAEIIIVKRLIKGRSKVSDKGES